MSLNITSLAANDIQKKYIEETYPIPPELYEYIRKEITANAAEGRDRAYLYIKDFFYKNYKQKPLYYDYAFNRIVLELNNNGFKALSTERDINLIIGW